jgi:hypothetical protein
MSSFKQVNTYTNEFRCGESKSIPFGSQPKKSSERKAALKQRLKDFRIENKNRMTNPSLLDLLICLDKGVDPLHIFCEMYDSVFFPSRVRSKIPSLSRGLRLIANQKIGSKKMLKQVNEFVDKFNAAHPNALQQRNRDIEVKRRLFARRWPRPVAAAAVAASEEQKHEVRVYLTKDQLLEMTSSGDKRPWEIRNREFMANLERN